MSDPRIEKVARALAALSGNPDLKVWVGTRYPPGTIWDARSGINHDGAGNVVEGEPLYAAAWEKHIEEAKRFIAVHDVLREMDDV